MPGKKLKIKPLKLKPRLPANFVESTWAKLRKAIEGIFSEEKVSYSFEELYRAAEDLCLHKKAQFVYESLVKECESQVTHVLGKLTQKQSASFLSELEKEWQTHCNQLLTIRYVELGRFRWGAPRRIASRRVESPLSRIPVFAPLLSYSFPSMRREREIKVLVFFRERCRALGPPEAFLTTVSWSSHRDLAASLPQVDILVLGSDLRAPEFSAQVNLRHGFAAVSEADRDEPRDGANPVERAGRDDHAGEARRPRRR